MNSKDEKANKRLLKIYGISLKEYEKLLKLQNGGCYICGKPPKPDKRLHVDHDHSFHKIKISVHKMDKDSIIGYIGTATGFPLEGTIATLLCKSKKEAKIAAKQFIMRKSVRGLLCWRHNTGLKKWDDNPTYMRKAAEYIERFKNEGVF